MKESDTFSASNDELFEKLNGFRKTGKFCDAVLTTREGASFHIHRVVMCLCSPYFRKLFTSTPAERASGESSEMHFQIQDVSPAILDKIVKYAYTGTVDFNESNVYRLLYAADQLKVSGMLDECSKFILKNLNHQNCICTWLLAKYAYNMTLMEYEARRFILTNFDKISETSRDFLKLKLDNLKDILSDDNLNTKNEKLVWTAIKRWSQYEYAERQRYIPSLLPCVRLALLSKKDFQQIANDPRVSRHMPCVKYINMVAEFFENRLSEPSSVEYDEDKAAITVFTPRHPREIIVITGGVGVKNATNNFEVYDCRANMWKVILSGDPFNRSYHQSVVLGKYIYIIGGRSGRKCINSCWRFDTSNFAMKKVSPMNERRSYLSAAVLNGKMYALGGYDGTDRLRTVEYYDEIHNQWFYISPMNEKRSDASASSFGNYIFVVGGFNGEACLQSAECYHPEYDQWVLLPNMIRCRSGLGCVALDYGVYAIGGFDGKDRMDSVEKYNMKRKQWVTVKSMEKPRSNFGVTVLENKIYVMGGYDQNAKTPMSQTECYDPEQNKWRRIAHLNISRSGFSACTLSGIQETAKYINDDKVRCLL